MTKEQMISKAMTLQKDYMYEEKFSKSSHTQKLNVWENYGYCRVYVPRDAYTQAGYIYLDDNNELTYKATRPGNAGILIEFITKINNN